MKKWMLYFDNKQSGPYAPIAIGRLLKMGKIDQNTSAWCHGMAEWKRIIDIDEVWNEISKEMPDKEECIQYKYDNSVNIVDSTTSFSNSKLGSFIFAFVGAIAILITLNLLGILEGFILFIVLILVFVCAVCSLTYLLKQNTEQFESILYENKQKLQKQADFILDVESQMNNQAQHILTLESRLNRIAKYEGIADAEEKANEIETISIQKLNNANIEATRIVEEANNNVREILSLAKAEAKKIISEANERTKLKYDEIKNILDRATKQSKHIIDEAHGKAKEIAGKAYDAITNAEYYERTACAMKNIIEGYGDKYLILERSLLDELAEDYGFIEAGAELQMARERTKLMITNRTAATCDYVEQHRKDTAINFVLDAFNGKVDSILSRVKHDNAGTLNQEIKDAFSIVNFNGNAFRNARIEDEYLTARLDELKWSEIVQQYKLKEREEQRMIKEQIREEEKARREYERALKETAKEEEYLKKAMEKAHLQIEKASAEQKEKYEKQLQELEIKLKETEDRNKRALSMAQQTRRGHVYIISNIGSFGENVYKIGLTRRLEPLDRIKELGDSSVPFEFDVHALIMSDDAPALEKKLHKHFLLMQMNKVNHRKEFFRTDIQHIKEEIENLGLQVKWTLTSDAKEYKETLAIEKAISENPEMRDAWVKRQLILEDIEEIGESYNEDES